MHTSGVLLFIALAKQAFQHFSGAPFITYVDIFFSRFWTHLCIEETTASPEDEGLGESFSSCLSFSGGSSLSLLMTERTEGEGNPFYLYKPFFFFSSFSIMSSLIPPARVQSLPCKNTALVYELHYIRFSGSQRLLLRDFI
jgi:hypothetical protein